MGQGQRIGEPGALTLLQGPALLALQGGRCGMPAPCSTVMGQLTRFT